MEDTSMMHWVKKIGIFVVILAAVLFLLRQFAPESVKQYFRV
jgi:hypothetical protein